MTENVGGRCLINSHPVGVFLIVMPTAIEALKVDLLDPSPFEALFQGFEVGGNTKVTYVHLLAFLWRSARPLIVESVDRGKVHVLGALKSVRCRAVFYKTSQLDIRTLGRAIKKVTIAGVNKGHVVVAEKSPDADVVLFTKLQR